MKFNIKVVNGDVQVTDEAGKPIDWVHTVDFVFAPGGCPILYLGTTAFAAEITAGNGNVPVPSPPVATG